MCQLAAVLFLVLLREPVNVGSCFGRDMDRRALRVARGFFERYDLVNTGFGQKRGAYLLLSR